MSFVSIDSTDFVVSSDSVTAPAWSNNATVLTTFATASNISNSPTFYVDVYSSASISTGPEFSITYGNATGLGSVYYNPIVSTQTPSRTIYGQYRTLVYGDENTNFNFGTGNSNSQDIYVINVNRSKYKEKLFLSTFNLYVSGTTGVNRVQLTNNSAVTTTTTFLDCGRVYDIVSGSNGTPTTAITAGASVAGYTASGSYGLFLPDVGLIVLNPAALDLSAVSGGIALSTNKTANSNQTNFLKLYEAIKRGATVSTNTGFQLNSEETISSDFIFTRIKNADFNYTTNPSMISGSGDLVYSTFINNPQTYITTVGLYNDNEDLLAVAKLSKPLVKDFTKESLIRVKLNW
jgi:hypothetical protein